MSVESLQLEVTLSLVLPKPEIPIKAFCFHYVNVETTGRNDRTDELGSDQTHEWIDGIKSDFFAMAVVGSVAGRELQPYCTQVSPGTYKMLLTDVPVYTPTGAATPSPYLRPGKYRLSSIEISTEHGTQFLLPPFDDVELEAITIPDATKTSSRAIKVSSVCVEPKFTSIP